MPVCRNRIKECRKENKLTQSEVAQKLGVGKQAVYKYESGTVSNIPLQNVVIMAEMFHVSPEYLIGWSDNKQDEKEKHLVQAFRLADPKYQDLALELLDEHPLKKE